MREQEAPQLPPYEVRRLTCGLLRPWNDIALARRAPTSTVLVGWNDG